MSDRRYLWAMAILAVVGMTPGCDAIDRARSGAPPADTLAAHGAGSGVMLGLQVPGVLSAGEEGILRLSITNRSDTVASQMHAELLIPGWVEPMPPRVGDREVSMAAMDGGGTRFSYRMADTPLEPGQTQAIEQRIRIPSPSPFTGTEEPWTRVVRARLLDLDGQALVEIESEIALDPALIPDTAGISPPPSAVGRDQLGGIRLGMTAAAVRQAVQGTRDTTWQQEGMSQNVLVAPISTGGRAFAVLSNDSVARIEVRDQAVRTREQTGVGSTLAQLRQAYGTPCADVGEGAVVVWFANAPGISFALDAPVPQNVAQMRQSPDRLPGSARVTRWWLRRGVDRCPG